MRDGIAAGIALAVLAGAPALAQPGQSAPAEWDRGAVDALAVDLAAAARALKDAVAREPRIAEAARAGDREAEGFLGSVADLGNSARRLARSLGDGQDRETTRPLVSRIRTQVALARRSGAGLLAGPWMEQNLDPVADLLEKLSAHYPD